MYQMSILLRLVSGILGYGILAYFLRDTGIFVDFFFILGYGIFRDFGIWDIGIYFGIRVKLGFGIWDTLDGLFWDLGYCLPP